MEPVSAPPKKGLASRPAEPGARAKQGRKGSLENPEVVENVPGHIIPILEREFDDFDNEAEKFLAGETAEDEFIGFRLKQGVYGQRQADVQMCRIKLPMGGVTPEQMEMFADVVEEYAPLVKGHITTRQNIQIHHVPAAPDGGADPQDLRRRPLLARGLREHGSQRDRRPLGRGERRRALRPHPLRRRLRALLRPPPHHPADAAEGQDGLHGHRRGPGDHRHPRHRLHPACQGWRARLRAAGGRGHVDHAPDRAHPLRLRGRRRRRVPEGRRGGVPDLRPPGVAAKEPRPRAHQGLRRQVRHRRAASPGGGGAGGRLGRRARLRSRRRCSSTTTRRRTSRRRLRRTPAPTGTARRSSASGPRTCSRSASRASPPWRSRWCGAT